MAKILLVEDDTNLSEIYQARMEAEGYTVVAAADGESALAIAAKEKPDLILSDVMMPKISGFEMLDILRNTEGLKSTKVIMLTALGQAEDRSRAETLGADKYLVKSQVTLEDIVSAARDLLGTEDALPTPQEMAAPTMNAAADAGVEPDFSTIPTQAAPTGPLEATTPAIVTEQPVYTEPIIEVPTVAEETPMTIEDPAVQAAASPGVTAADTTVATVAASLADDTDDEADDTTPDATLADETFNAADPTAVDPLAELLPSDQDQDNPVPQPTAAPVAGPAQPAEPPSTTFNPAAFDTTTGQESPLPPATTVSGAAPTVIDSTAAVSLTQPDPVVPMPGPAPETAPDAPAPQPTAALSDRQQPVAISSMLVHSPNDPTTSAPIGTMPTATTPAVPVPETELEPQVTAADIDEKVVANAVGKLMAKSPEVSADITPGATTDSRQRKKIIAPIPHTPEPSLDELLAKEAAKEAGNIVAPAGAPAQAAAQAETAATLDSDEAAAAAMLAQAQATSNSAATMAPAVPSPTADPLSVALPPLQPDTTPFQLPGQEPPLPVEPAPAVANEPQDKPFDPNSISL